MLTFTLRFLQTSHLPSRVILTELSSRIRLLLPKAVALWRSAMQEREAAGLSEKVGVV